MGNQSGKLRVAAAAVLGAVAVASWLVWRFVPNGGDGLSVAAQAQQPRVPASSASISADDLPHEGTRSLFDHLIAQNDGLPYPFEKLVELIERQNPAGEPPLVLMIPDGRSLLKASADYQHPRVLVAADFQAPNNDANLGLAPRGQLFLGFVENAAEIEVLSYNEAAGRFEFQLVQDYRADGARRIVYARRQICTTCHQGDAPIFPQRPWNETNGQPETAAKILETRGADTPYLKAPLVVPLDTPERFDQLTDVGNFIPATQRIWIDGCGGELSASEALGADARPALEGQTGSVHSEKPISAANGSPHADQESASCRRQLLKVALQYLWNPAEFDAQSAEAQKLRALQAARWPADGIAVTESDLRNRNPLAEKKGLKGWIRQWLTQKPPPGAAAKDNEDLAAFDRLPRLPLDLDPLTPRPPKQLLSAQDIDGAFGIAALLSASDFERLEKAAAYQKQTLLAAVDRAAPAVFAPAPFVRVAVMNALLAALQQPALAYCCLDVSEMSPPVAAGTPKVEITTGSPLMHFEQYCFACHRGNPARRLDFMSGATEAEVLEQIKAKAEIRDALDWGRYKGTDKENKLMPPSDSPQHAKLVQALESDPELLKKMSAVIPGLFDF